MKKIVNILIIASVVALSGNSVLAKKQQVDENLLASKKQKEIQIVEPDNVKVNHKTEIKKMKSNANLRQNLRTKQKVCMKQNFLLSIARLNMLI